MDSCWAKKGRKESVKPGVESVEPIVQYSTRPANVFSFFFFFSSGLRADFSLRCSEGSRTQSSREI